MPVASRVADKIINAGFFISHFEKALSNFFAASRDKSVGNVFGLHGLLIWKVCHRVLKRKYGATIGTFDLYWGIIMFEFSFIHYN